MGLQLAVKAHTDGDLVLAETHYKRAYGQGDHKPLLYQNYGALLRSTDRLDEAISLYENGLKKYPNNISILSNYANAIREQNASKAISTYLKVLSRHFAEDPTSEQTHKSLLNISSFLYEKGLFAWNLQLLKVCIPHTGLTSGILQNLILLLDSPDRFVSDNSEFDVSSLTLMLENSVSNLDNPQKIELRFVLFQHYLNSDRVQDALFQYEEAQRIIKIVRSSKEAESRETLEKIEKNIDVNNWNAACTLLRLQDFERGWSMYDYGLRAPCAGPQRWQRSLAKPFPASSLPLWKGESLQDMKMLLLEEQGVGDAMMFITLVPALLKECAQVSLFLSDRLVPVYQNSFKKEIHNGSIRILSRADYYSKKFNASDFDYQSPLGSICRHRFSHPSMFAPVSPILSINSSISSELRNRYLSFGDQPVEKLIGVSWRGGGRSGRIKQKSIRTADFGHLMKNLPGYRFVSLQYGESKKIVDEWRSEGIDILHDDNINPLKDIDSWLCQVAACDAVLSVANTTIHGAGGLNIPTYCLLSRHADWRWLSSTEVQRSYWYPSVGIFRESEELGWTPALDQARQWLLAGAPSPHGLTYV